MEIQAAPVEAVSRYTRLVPADTSGSIHLGAVGVLTVPNRRDPEGYRPVGRVLIDGGIALVAQLIAVVLERLSERAQHGPCLMTGRARHTVLASERGYSANRYPWNGQRRSRPRISEQNGENEKRTQNREYVVLDSSLQQGGIPKGHIASSA